jgi:hypothetical protein
LRATLEKPRVAELIRPHKAGRLVNQVRKLAEEIYPLPRVDAPAGFSESEARPTIS